MYSLFPVSSLLLWLSLCSWPSPGGRLSIASGHFQNSARFLLSEKHSSSSSLSSKCLLSYSRRVYLIFLVTLYIRTGLLLYCKTFVFLYFLYLLTRMVIFCEYINMHIFNCLSFDSKLFYCNTSCNEWSRIHRRWSIILPPDEENIIYAFWRVSDFMCFVKQNLHFCRLTWVAQGVDRGKNRILWFLVFRHLNLFGFILQIVRRMSNIGECVLCASKYWLAVCWNNCSYPESQKSSKHGPEHALHRHGFWSGRYRPYRTPPMTCTSFDENFN